MWPQPMSASADMQPTYAFIPTFTERPDVPVSVQGNKHPNPLLNWLTGQYPASIDDACDSVSALGLEKRTGAARIKRELANTNQPAPTQLEEHNFAKRRAQVLVLSFV